MLHVKFRTLAHQPVESTEKHFVAVRNEASELLFGCRFDWHKLKDVPKVGETRTPDLLAITLAALPLSYIHQHVKLGAGVRVARTRLCL